MIVCPGPDNDKWSNPGPDERCDLNLVSSLIRDALTLTRLSFEMSSAPVYTFELPTTGSISFVDYFSSGSGVYTYQISDATQARANLRAVLKESKHGDGDKDYLRLVKARLTSSQKHSKAASYCQASRR